MMTHRLHTIDERAPCFLSMFQIFRIIHILKITFLTFVYVTDTHCTQLVHELKIGEPLANVLKTSDNIKVQHAVISVLKNISLPGT